MSNSNDGEKKEDVVACGVLYSSVQEAAVFEKPPPPPMKLQAMGEVKTPGDGREYIIGHLIGEGPTTAPVVVSKHTGRWWILPWHQVIALARLSGIDDYEVTPTNFLPVAVPEPPLKPGANRMRIILPGEDA